MIRRLSLLLATFALAACALPFASQPTPEPSAPTTAPLTNPTRAPAPTRAASAPTAATQPTANTQPATPAAAAEDVDDPARIAAAVPAERDQVTLAEAFKHIGDIPRVARTTPLDVKVGDTEKFWVSNVRDNTNYTVTAKLRYVGPVALMY